MHGLTEVYLQASDHTPGSIHSMYICSTLFAFLLRVQNMIFLQFPKDKYFPHIKQYLQSDDGEWMIITERQSLMLNEWVGDWCLTPAQQFFSYIMAKTT